MDKQGVVLLPAAAHEVLKGGDELEGSEAGPRGHRGLR